MHRIQLIAMDMDGTLLDDQQRIPAENLRALLAANAQGVHIAIASGRSASDVSYYASDAGLSACHVLALNGGCCLEAPHAAPYALHTLPPDVALAAADVLLRHQVTFACFQAEHVLVITGRYGVDKRNWGTHIARKGANAYQYGVQAFTQSRGEGICKLVFIDQEGAPNVASIRDELAPIAGLSVSASWSNNLELMPEGVNKGRALRELTARLGLTPGQVMALGDFDNDLDMIEYAGLGIAMGNASERVKRAAKAVTLTNREWGVAAAIDRYVLHREG